ncbi:hypothetical protein ACFSMW_15815 [Virgibacillus halophilus]|uniref:Uncharacterized protein n=1 Tax=Tigheibacillus halophilus TaxID=361280 RepID=A0ABU5CCE4_9BACI|nr:hypothetical protein [Virgibacillus halophilus]
MLFAIQSKKVIATYISVEKKREKQAYCAIYLGNNPADDANKNNFSITYGTHIGKYTYVRYNADEEVKCCESMPILKRKGVISWK